MKIIEVFQYAKLYSSLAALEGVTNKTEIAALSLSKAFGVSASSAEALIAVIGSLAPYLLAIGAAVAILDAVTVSFDEAVEKANASKQAYEQTQSEIQSLNSELETTQSRIDELQAKGSLNIVEQEELERLQASNDSLERRIELLDAIARTQRDDMAATAADALTNHGGYTLFNDGGGYKNTFWNKLRYQSSPEAMQYQRGVDVIEYAAEKQRTLNKLTADYNALRDTDPTSTQLSAIKDQIDDINAEMSDILPDIMDWQESIAGYDEYADTYERIESLWASMETDASKAAAAQKKVDDVLSRPTLKQARQDAEALAKEMNGIDVSTLEEQFPEIARAARAVGVEIEDVVNTINSAAGTVNFDEIRRQLRDLRPSSAGVNEWYDFINHLADTNLVDLFNMMKTAATEGWDFNDVLAAWEEQQLSAQTTESVIGALSDEYVTLSSAINESEQAMEDLSEVMNKNSDAGYDQRVSAYDAINEAFENGEVGSMSNIWDMAEALGATQDVLDGFDPQKLFDWCVQTAQYFTEGQDGINAFLDDINDLDAGVRDSVFREFFWDGETLTFDIDESQFAKLGDLFDLNEGAVYDLITAIGQYYNIQMQTPQDFISYMQNIAAGAGTAEEKFNALRTAIEQALAAEGYSDEEIQMAVDTGEIEDASETVSGLLSTYNDCVEQIKNNPVGVTGENGDTQLEFKVTVDNEEFTLALDTDEQRLQEVFGKDWKLVLESAEAEGKLDIIYGLIENIPEGKATVRNNTGAAISGLSSVMSWIRQVKNNGTQTVTVNVVTKYSTTGTPASNTKTVGKYASGTRNAQPGLALLGDEYSEVGEPKPELVVSGDRAYVAGVNGPTVAQLDRGDVVYTADETKKILGGNLISGSIPAFSAGGGTTWSGGGFRPDSSTGGLSNSNYNTSSSSNTKSSSDDEESWFEKQYKAHNHLVNMMREDMSDYLDWLAEAVEKAYDEGVIELDEYRNYHEEVFNGLKDLFLDYLSDVEHEISMREHFDGETKTILKLYQNMIDATQKEIAAARAQGLDDTDEYIQQLQDKYWDYYDSINNIRDEVAENAKDTLEELVDIRIKMIKQDVSDEKDALKKRLDALKEFYQQQKDLLQDAYDEETYAKKQAELRKNVTDLQLELNQLEYDDSAWAQKRKIELAQELADAQDELYEFEREHALQIAQNQLDEQQKIQEKAIEDEEAALDETLANQKALRDRALEDIRTDNGILYNEMLEWNRIWGDGIDETITAAWTDAYKALKDYHDLYGEYYNDVNLDNSTGYEEPDGGWDNSPISGTNPSNAPAAPAESTPAPAEKVKVSAPTLAVGSYVKLKSGTWWKAASDGTGASGSADYWLGGRSAKIAQINNASWATHPYRIEGYGWVKKSDIVGYEHGTAHATAGLHAFDENGAEAIFESSDGTKYRMFANGEKVLNADATNFLYDFANSGGKIITDMIRHVFGSGGLGNIGAHNTVNEVRMGDIIVQGNASERTVSEIRRAQRENVDYMLKQFHKLNV